MRLVGILQCPLVAASTTRACRERVGRAVGKFHPAYRAAEPVAHRAPLARSTRHLVAEPDKKYPAEKDEQADKNQPLEADRNHGLLPHSNVTIPQASVRSDLENLTPRRNPAICLL